MSFVLNSRQFRASISMMRRIIIIGLLVLTGSLDLSTATRAETTNRLAWDRERNKVSADVHDWPLLTLLEDMASQSGWHIFVEPDSAFRASAKFQDLAPGEALRRLLGSMNYTMMPATNGAQRLYVFRTVIKNATQQIRSATPPGRAQTQTGPE